MGPDPRRLSRQGWIGGTLALLLIGTWLALHIYGVFILQAVPGLLATLALMAVLTWLSVGLFIVGHDAMHGSLVPAMPRLNRALGALAIFLYAGFSFDRLLLTHKAHHVAPGSADDPDFAAAHPRSFWSWYGCFMRRYLNWREGAIMAARVGLYLALGASLATVILFYAVPAIAASLQLFYFGTYRPHRHEEAAFADSHNARTNEFGWLASLLSCFHFGYHHEHHLHPGIPWWALPACRRDRRNAV